MVKQINDLISLVAEAVRTDTQQEALEYLLDHTPEDVDPLIVEHVIIILNNVHKNP